MPAILVPPSSDHVFRVSEGTLTHNILSLLRRQQILDHMNESGVYNEADLAPFHRRLAELR